MEKSISNIVFTRNRPLQLEAYLESLYRHLPEERIRTYLLYKVDLFEEQYEELFQQFPDCVVVREKNFHDDLLMLMNRLRTPFVLFGTDDVVYYDSVDYALIEDVFTRFPEDIFGFSLRLSPEKLKGGGEPVQDYHVRDEKVYRVSWKHAQSRDARYPFELDSTIYKSGMVKAIVGGAGREFPGLNRIFRKDSLLVRGLDRIVSMKHFLDRIHTFHDPNTLEGSGYRWCRRHASRLPDGLYFQKPCASAVQINRVNLSVSNPTDGSTEHSVENLNEKYKRGYRFDVAAVERHKPTDTHVGRDYVRLVKCMKSCGSRRLGNQENHT